ncbi:hypothetical protein JTB14_019334 [Gonioctena quinquepunctata]|nr:hypothetical protein JTB14_019334 [Gonioctena quinquepunctata]
MNVYVDVLANLIIQQYFSSSRCLLVFTDNVNRFDYNGTIPMVNVRINSRNFVNTSIFLRYHGCQGIIIKTNSPKSIFADLEHEIKLTTERFNYRKYLFLPGDNMSENGNNIFHTDELKYVADLVVVKRKRQKNETKTLFSKDEIYSLWTHRYVGLRNNSGEMFLDQWFSKNRSFKLGTDLYLEKLYDQMSRLIEMATFQYEPYSIIGSDEKEPTGSEMLIALMFAKQYNMTPILVVNEEDYWGEVFNNWTGKGLLGNLVEDKADIGFSALYTWEVDYYFLDFSKTMIRTGITCLVPAPKFVLLFLNPIVCSMLKRPEKNPDIIPKN